MTKTDWPREPIDNKAIAALERVLKHWCVEHACERGSAQAQIAAKTLIDWFEFGVHD